MAEKKSNKAKSTAKPVKVSGEAKRMRAMNVVFLFITAIVIFSMIAAAVMK